MDKENGTPAARNTVHFRNMWPSGELLGSCDRKKSENTEVILVAGMNQEATGLVACIFFKNPVPLLQQNRFQNVNVNFRILKWRYCNYHIRPYFVEISPYIAST